MKITYLINALSYFGGAEKVAVSLAAHLKKHHQVDMEVVYVWQETRADEAQAAILPGMVGGALEKILQEAHVPMVSLKKPVNSGLGFAFRTCRFYWQHLRRRQPDLVHSHCFHPDLLNAALTYGAVRVRTLHNQRYDFVFEHGLEWVLAPRFRATVAVAPSLCAHWARRSPRSAAQIRCVPNPISSYFVGKGKQRKHLPDEPKLGLIGRLAPQKGHVYAFRLLKKLHRRQPRASLYLAGDGELKTSLQQYVQQNQITRVHFLGSLSEPDMLKLYHELDLLLVPSLFEGFNLAAYEAAATGLPLLGTDVVGIKDLLQRMGAKPTPVGDVEAMVAAFWHLYENPSMYAQLSRKGMAQSEDFSLARVAEAHHGLYTELLAAREWRKG